MEKIVHYRFSVAQLQRENRPSCLASLGRSANKEFCFSPGSRPHTLDSDERLASLLMSRYQGCSEAGRLQGGVAFFMFAWSTGWDTTHSEGFTTVWVLPYEDHL